MAARRGRSPNEAELCSVGVDQTVTETADRLYRDLRPGVKFNDADLLGMPIRVVASTRSLAQQSLEVKLRNAKEAQLIPLENGVETLRKIIAAEMAKLQPEG